MWTSVGKAVLGGGKSKHHSPEQPEWLDWGPETRRVEQMRLELDWGRKGRFVLGLVCRPLYWF